MRAKTGEIRQRYILLIQKLAGRPKSKRLGQSDHKVLLKSRKTLWREILERRRGEGLLRLGLGEFWVGIAPGDGRRDL